MRNVFRWKSKNPYPACIIYEGTCMGTDIHKISDTSIHLKNDPTHSFPRKVLISASINDCVRKNIEASFLAVSRQSLNEQIDSKILLLFQNGATWQIYSFNL